MKTCSIEGCENELRARGWCPTHWKRWKVHGDPNVCTTNRHIPLADRFWMKVAKGPGCWNWTGSLVTAGYGSIMERVDGRNHHHVAHRLSYELMVGPIPEGMMIDHRCFNRKCVNPEHLRLATHKQNMENLAGARRISQTGVRGVCRRRGKFVASIGHNNATYYLGQYETLEEAESVVTAKRIELFTHNDADRISAP